MMQRGCGFFFAPRRGRGPIWQLRVLTKVCPLRRECSPTQHTGKSMLAFVPLYSLGASPPVKQALVPYKFASVAVPEWTIGYYTWSWLAQKSSGSESANMGVQFSGEIDVTAALKAVGALTLPCDDVQKSWCDGQLDFYANAGKSPEEARMTIMEEFSDACRSCLITPEDASEAWAHPFSLKSGMYNGAQYLSLLSLIHI